MAMGFQNFESYPNLDGGNVRQATNYAMGAGGTSSTSQFRPTSGTQVKPVRPAPTKTPGAPAQPQVQPVSKIPGVPTQAPSPSVAPRWNGVGSPTLGGFQPRPAVPAPAGSTITRTADTVPQTGVQRMPAPRPVYVNPMQEPGAQQQLDDSRPWGGPVQMAPQNMPVLMPAQAEPAMAGGASPDNNSMNALIQALQQAMGGAAQAPRRSLSDLGGMIEELMADPSRARREGMQTQFGRLTDDLQERINQDAVSRGLEFSDVPTQLFAREAGDLAARMQEQEALASADDYTRAIQLAHGFGQQGFENQLATRGQDMQEMDLLNRLGATEFGQQSANQDQLLRELQMLMGMGDYALAPLNPAVGAGFDYSGALGEQAAGSADIAAQLARLIPQLAGRSGTPAAAGSGWHAGSW